MHWALFLLGIFAPTKKDLSINHEPTLISSFFVLLRDLFVLCSRTQSLMTGWGLVKRDCPIDDSMSLCKNR